MAHVITELMILSLEHTLNTAAVLKKHLSVLILEQVPFKQIHLFCILLLLLIIIILTPARPFPFN